MPYISGRLLVVFNGTLSGRWNPPLHPVESDLIFCEPLFQNHCNSILGESNMFCCMGKRKPCSSNLFQIRLVLNFGRSGLIMQTGEHFECISDRYQSLFSRLGVLRSHHSIPINTNRNCSPAEHRILFCRMTLPVNEITPGICIQRGQRNPTLLFLLSLTLRLPRGC